MTWQATGAKLGLQIQPKATLEKLKVKGPWTTNSGALR